MPGSVVDDVARSEGFLINRRRSSLYMPYFFIAPAFALYLVLGGILVVACRVIDSRRRLLSYVWRIWLWGGIGFVVANMLLVAILYVPLTHLAVSGSAKPSHEIVDIIVGVAVLLGPFVASVFGLLVGAGADAYLAWRINRVARANG